MNQALKRLTPGACLAAEANPGVPRQYRCSTSNSKLNFCARRNRVAHHEPIFHKPLVKTHDEIIEAIRWMCKSTAAWSIHHSRVVVVVTGAGLSSTHQAECPTGVNENPGQWELTGGRRSTRVSKDLTHTPNIQAKASGCQCGNRPSRAAV
jgi:hypothetical protein